MEKGEGYSNLAIYAFFQVMDSYEALQLSRDCPDKFSINLLHYRQRYNWDCGIACVLMILPEKERRNLLRNFSTICREEGIYRSTWTIDLCYLLRRYNVGHDFYTVTLGIHPGYKDTSFYNSILDKDERRINRKFEEAEANGIDVQNGAVTASFILEQLNRGPVIVLTNARLLSCDACKLNKLSAELRKCLPWLTKNYQGHYIVLCGYNVNTQKVYYRNPSLSDRVCIMSIETLEEARKCYGTDQDVIFTYLPKLSEL